MPRLRLDMALRPNRSSYYCQGVPCVASKLEYAKGCITIQPKEAQHDSGICLGPHIYDHHPFRPQRGRTLLRLEMVPWRKVGASPCVEDGCASSRPQRSTDCRQRGLNFTMKAGAKQRRRQAAASLVVKVSVASTVLAVACSAPLLVWRVTKPRHKRISVEDLRKVGL